MNRQWNGSCEDWLHGDEHLSDSCDSEFENSEEDKGEEEWHQDLEKTF